MLAETVPQTDGQTLPIFIYIDYILMITVSGALGIRRVVEKQIALECGPKTNVMVALPNIGGALCSTPQTLADAHCWSRPTVQ